VWFRLIGLIQRSGLPGGALSRVLGELSQLLCHDDSTIIVVVYCYYCFCVSVSAQETSIESYEYNGVVYRVGDFVYVEQR